MSAPAPRLLAAIALSVALAPPALAQSAWLPMPGETRASAAYSSKRFDDFWLGATRTPFPGGGTQRTWLLTLERGLTGRLAADLTGGWTRSEAMGTCDAMTDTHVGLSLALLAPPDPEAASHSALALRVGGIVQGTYGTGMASSIGDGANGGEITLHAAHAWRAWRLGARGEAGWRVRAEDVPQEWLAAAGLSIHPAPAVELGGGYRYSGARSGLDIGGPGFSPARLPQVREIQHVVEGAVAVSDPWGLQWTAFLASTVAGRNTDIQTVVGGALSVAF